jgi:hypothetical protein
MSDMQDATPKPMSEPAHTAPSADAQATSTASGPWKTIFGQWKLLIPAAGGLALLIHFWRIGYTPTLSFADLGTVLWAVLLFATTILLIVLLLLIFPSVVLAYWVDQHLLIPPDKWAEPKARSKRSGLRSYHRRSDRDAVRTKPIIPSLFRSGSFFWFIATAGWTAAVYVAVVYATFHDQTLDLSATVTLLFVIAITALCAIFFALEVSFFNRRLRLFRAAWIQFLLVSVLYLAFWPLLLTIFTAARVDLKGVFTMVFAAGLLYVPLLHFVWYRTHRPVSGSSIRPFVRWVPALVVVVYTGLPFLIVDRGMNAFGLGMIPRVDVVLTARGCDIAHAAWPQRACAPQRRDGLDAYRLENVEVLTRIGAHYYVGAPGAMRNDALVRFPIPSDEVLSWRRRPDVPKPATPTKPAKTSKH